MKYSIVAVAVAAPILANAQQSTWGQCGGVNWSGPSSCVSGTSCTTLNPYYAQCIPGAAQPTTSSRTTTTTSSRTTTTPVITTTPRTTTPGVTTTSRTTTGSQPAGTGLHAVAVRNGLKYFGFATDPNSFAESQVVNIIRAESGQVTPENSMKWESIHPSENTYNWGNADSLVNFAQQNNQLIRGHTLLWHSQLPQWVKNINNKAALTTVIQNHVAQVAGRYKGKIESWDVANEVLNDDGTMRTSVFSTVFGDYTFLDVVFRAAKAADPTAKLCLNDYNLDYSGPKLNNFVTLVNQLKSRGVPIDCVGTQSHLVVGNGAIPYTQQQLATLAQPGLEIQITELDIRAPTPVSQASISQQVTDYKNVACGCKKTALCKTITVWGVSDKHSWVPSTFSGQGYALLWTDNYTRKAAIQGTIDGLNC